MIVLEVLGWIMASLGCVVVLIGAVGVVRMPDLYTRMHAAGLSDSLGSALVLIGLALTSGSGTTVARLLMIVAFLWITSPTACHALAKSARAAGIVPWRAPGDQADGVPTAAPRERELAR